MALRPDLRAPKTVQIPPKTVQIPSTMKGIFKKVSIGMLVLDTILHVADYFLAAFVLNPDDAKQAATALTNFDIMTGSPGPRLCNSICNIRAYQFSFSRRKCVS